RIGGIGGRSGGGAGGRCGGVAGLPVRPTVVPPSAKTREIEKRIKAAGNSRRSPRTMQMVATREFARAKQRALATKPSTEGVFGLVTELAATAGNASHPLINGPAGKTSGRELTLIITSDRGLCGPYNSSVLRTAMGHLRSTPAARNG